MADFADEKGSSNMPSDDRIQLAKDILSSCDGEPMSWDSFLLQYKEHKPPGLAGCSELSIEDSFCRNRVPGIISSRDFIAFNNPRNTGLLKLMLIVTIGNNDSHSSKVNNSFQLIATDEERDMIGRDYITLSQSLLNYPQVFHHDVGTGSIKLMEDKSQLHKSFFNHDRPAASARNKLKYFLFLCNGVSPISALYAFATNLLSEPEKQFYDLATEASFAKSFKSQDVPLRVANDTVSLLVSAEPPEAPTQNLKQTTPKNLDACNDVMGPGNTVPTEEMIVSLEGKREKLVSILEAANHAVPWEYITDQLVASQFDYSWLVHIKEHCPDEWKYSPFVIGKGYISLNTAFDRAFLKVCLLVRLFFTYNGRCSLDELTAEFRKVSSGAEKREFYGPLSLYLKKFPLVFDFSEESSQKACVLPGREMILFEEFFRCPVHTKGDCTVCLIKQFINISGGRCHIDRAFHFLRITTSLHSKGKNELHSDEFKRFVEGCACLTASQDSMLCIDASVQSGDDPSNPDLRGSAQSTFSHLADQNEPTVARGSSHQFLPCSKDNQEDECDNELVKYPAFSAHQADTSSTVPTGEMKVSLKGKRKKLVSILEAANHAVPWKYITDQLVASKCDNSWLEYFKEHCPEEWKYHFVVGKSYISLNTDFDRGFLKICLLVRLLFTYNGRCSLDRLTSEFHKVSSRAEEKKFYGDSMTAYLKKFPSVFNISAEETSVSPGREMVPFEEFFLCPEHTKVGCAICLVKQFINISGGKCHIDEAFHVLTITTRLHSDGENGLREDQFKRFVEDCTCLTTSLDSMLYLDPSVQSCDESANPDIQEFAQSTPSQLSTVPVACESRHQFPPGSEDDQGDGCNNDHVQSSASSIHQADTSSTVPTEEVEFSLEGKREKLVSILEAANHAVPWEYITDQLIASKCDHSWFEYFKEHFPEEWKYSPFVISEGYISLNTAFDRGFLKICLLVRLFFTYKGRCSIDELTAGFYKVSSNKERREYYGDLFETNLKKFPLVFGISEESSPEACVSPGREMVLFEELSRCLQHSKEGCTICLIEQFINISGGSCHIIRAFHLLRITTALHSEGKDDLHSDEFERFVEGCACLTVSEDSILCIRSSVRAADDPSYPDLCGSVQYTHSNLGDRNQPTVARESQRQFPPCSEDDPKDECVNVPVESPSSSVPEADTSSPSPSASGESGPTERISLEGKREKLESILEAANHAVPWKYITDQLTADGCDTSWLEYSKVHCQEEWNYSSFIIGKGYISLDTAFNRGFLKICLLVRLFLTYESGCFLDELRAAFKKVTTRTERTEFTGDLFEAYMKKFPLVFDILEDSSLEACILPGREMVPFEDLFRCPQHSKEGCTICLIIQFMNISGGKCHINRAFHFLRITTKLHSKGKQELQSDEFEHFVEGCACLTVSEDSVLYIDSSIQAGDEPSLSDLCGSVQSTPSHLAVGNMPTVANESQQQFLTYSEAYQQDECDNGRIPASGVHQADTPIRAPSASGECTSPAYSTRETSESSTTKSPDDSGQDPEANSEMAHVVQVIGSDAVLERTLSAMRDTNKSSIAISCSRDVLVAVDCSQTGFLVSISSSSDASNQSRWKSIQSFFETPKIIMVTFDCENVVKCLLGKIDMRNCAVFDIKSALKLIVSKGDTGAGCVDSSISELCHRLNFPGPDQVSLQIVGYGKMFGGDEHSVFGRSTEMACEAASLVPKVFWWVFEKICEVGAMNDLEQLTKSKLQYLYMTRGASRTSLTSSFEEHSVPDMQFGIRPSATKLDESDSVHGSFASSNLNPARSSRAQACSLASGKITPVQSRMESYSSDQPGSTQIPQTTSLMSEAGDPLPDWMTRSTFPMHEHPHPLAEPSYGHMASIDGMNVPQDNETPLVDPSGSWFSGGLRDEGKHPYRGGVGFDDGHAVTLCLRKDGDNIIQVPQDEAGSYGGDLSGLTEELSQTYCEKLKQDIAQLLDMMGDDIRDTLGSHLKHHGNMEELTEIIVDAGRLAQARFYKRNKHEKQTVVSASSKPITPTDIQSIGNEEALTGFDDCNRCGIEGTLHSVRGVMNRKQKLVGLTIRVGQPRLGCAGMVYDIATSDKAMLILGYQGVGKTTLLRELARCLSDNEAKRVVVIDTYNEIAGDSDCAHFSIGCARRFQIEQPGKQHGVMLESAANHSPDVIIVDQIDSREDVSAVTRLNKSGIQVIAGTNRESIESLFEDDGLSELFRNVTPALNDTVSLDSAGALARTRMSPPFQALIEMKERDCWYIHDLSHSYRNITTNQAFSVQERRRIRYGGDRWDEQIQLREIQIDR